MFATSSRATSVFARGALNSGLFLAAVGLLSAQAAALSAGDVLRAHAAARAKLGLHDARTIETSGTLAGEALQGTFHSWHQGNRDRLDQELGSRTERTLRLGTHEYIQNSSGDVRELSGVLARRQRTADLITSGEFADHPEYARLLGETRLADGRDVWQVLVSPPDGQPHTVSLDASTWLVDEVAFVENDGIQTQDYYDQHVVRGTLVPYTEIDSNGDRQYDVIQRVNEVKVNAAMPPAIFAPFVSTTIAIVKPVTVKLELYASHLYVPVTIRGHVYRFLIDTGAQAVVVDAHVASEQLLLPLGLLEVTGTRRVGALGVAALDSIGVGGVRVPVSVVSVLDMGNVTGGAFPVDGVLGYPFFAEAEVRIDPDALTMTFAKPGTLPPLGAKIALDTDRQFPETEIAINGMPGRALIDTGNGTELLIFRPFALAHPGLIASTGSGQVSHFGVGGAISAVGATVDELAIGPYHLYNRYANLMLSQTGAFADRTNAGNVGYATLRNFIATFDLANRTLYLERARSFDDGRYRARLEEIRP